MTIKIKRIVKTTKTKITTKNKTINYKNKIYCK